MKRTLYIGFLAFVVIVAASGCRKENKVKDRTEATEMFSRIVALTEEYTAKIAAVPDSTEWSAMGKEFEEKLDKINFSYPPDTDLLMTEGQNDTITALMSEYVTARDRRIRSLLHPYIPVDTISAIPVMTGSTSE